MTTHHTHYGMPAMRSMTPARTLAALIGAVFLLVGVLGFIPGITQHLDTITFASHTSGAMLLGVFQVTVLHNLVHLLFGVAGLAMAATRATARTFLLGGGVIYLALWIYGLVIDRASDANFVGLNTADNWLHLGLGAVMVLLGVLTGRMGVHGRGVDGV